MNQNVESFQLTTHIWNWLHAYVHRAALLKRTTAGISIILGINRLQNPVTLACVIKQLQAGLCKSELTVGHFHIHPSGVKILKP